MAGFDSQPWKGELLESEDAALRNRYYVTGVDVFAPN